MALFKRCITSSTLPSGLNPSDCSPALPADLSSELANSFAVWLGKSAVY